MGGWGVISEWGRVIKETCFPLKWGVRRLDVNIVWGQGPLLLSNLTLGYLQMVSYSTRMSFSSLFHLIFILAYLTFRVLGKIVE